MNHASWCVPLWVYITAGGVDHFWCTPQLATSHVMKASQHLQFWILRLHWHSRNTLTQQVYTSQWYMPLNGIYTQEVCTFKMYAHSGSVYLYEVCTLWKCMPFKLTQTRRLHIQEGYTPFRVAHPFSMHTFQHALLVYKLSQFTYHFSLHNLSVYILF